MIELFSFLGGLSVFAYLGALSGVLSLFCFVPYIWDTLSGRTQPERASWLIWSVLGVIAVFSQGLEGASASLMFAVVQVGCTVVICVLSIWYGAGHYLSRRNRAIFAVAVFGVGAWYVTDSAVYALAVTISISLLGGCVTIQKSYVDPASETMSTWVVAALAAACATLSVGRLDWVLLAYPLYLLVLYTGILCALLLGRRAQRKASEDRGAVFVRPGARGPAVQMAPTTSRTPQMPLVAAFVAREPLTIEDVFNPPLQSQADLWSEPATGIPARPARRSKLWFAQSRPMAEATSAIRHENPHSLSYQARTRTVRPPTTLV